MAQQLHRERFEAAIQLERRRDHPEIFRARASAFGERLAGRAHYDDQVRPVLLDPGRTGPDRALTTVGGQPAELLNNNPYPANQNVNHWLDPTAFGQPALGTYGNLGLNNLKGPGVFQLNLSLSRTFPIAEHKSFQLRGEVFNLPNHLNPFTPGIAPINGTLFGGQQNQNANNLGQITNDISGNNGLLPGDYRVIQFALKFVF